VNKTLWKAEKLILEILKDELVDEQYFDNSVDFISFKKW
jgi:hypothetical protein